MQRRWLDRDCADRVVWTVVGSGLVDGQELDEFETHLCDPIDEFAQGGNIANSKVIFAAQRK